MFLGRSVDLRPGGLDARKPSASGTAADHAAAAESEESRLQGLARQLSWAAAVELWAADRGSETAWGMIVAAWLLAHPQNFSSSSLGDVAAMLTRSPEKKDLTRSVLFQIPEEMKLSELPPLLGAGDVRVPWETMQANLLEIVKKLNFSVVYKLLRASEDQKDVGKLKDAMAMLCSASRMCRQRKDPLEVAEKLERCCKRFQELELDNCLFIERIAGQNHFIRRVPDQIGRVLSEMIERLHLAAVWDLVLQSHSHSHAQEAQALGTEKGLRTNVLLCNESSDGWIAARVEPKDATLPPFLAASPTEGLPLQTPDVCHFLRADLNAVPALPQRSEEVRPGRGCGTHSPVHSRGRCENFMVTMPRQDPQRMTSPETSPIHMSKHLPRFEIMSVYEDNNKRSRLLFIPRLLMADSCESGGSEGGEDVVTRASKRPRTGGRARHSRGVSAGTGSVCKLFVKRVPCNFADPWRKHSQSASTGTGFLLDGRFVVTNAHVVHRAVSVLVRATVGPPVKWNARVLAVGLPCDLAILAVEDEFWKGKESLTLSRDIPKLDDNVTCIGFPVGGENISVTRGVVSRIDVHHDGLLRVQIDAAINPGNSGGPVLGSHGKIVGVAASHLKHASNIGYIIPTQVLEQFISCAGLQGAPERAAEGGEPAKGYLGVSSLGVGSVQTLETSAGEGSWHVEQLIVSLRIPQKTFQLN
eukprot:s4452_g7.t1